MAAAGMDSKSKTSDGISAAEEEQFLKMISRIQSGRMEEQRCFLQPSRSTPSSPTHNGSALNKSRRLDNQRVALPTLPGISGNSEGKVDIQRHTTAEIPVMRHTWSSQPQWIPQPPAGAGQAFSCNLQKFACINSIMY
uniref:Uncharacterized protein n=1 Tax=Haplochromis burtoni TaxID=8153 RepID=A0A3Q2UVJ8_HAPBU